MTNLVLSHQAGGVEATLSEVERTRVFRELYDKEIHYVWTSLQRLGIPARDASDLAHEAFMIVHRLLDDVDRTRPMRPWLFAIVCRVAAKHRRKRAHADEMLVPAEAVSDAPDAERLLMSKDAQSLFERALQAVAEERRPVFLLYEVEDTPMAEIANLLGIPANTAYSRLRLARDEFARAAKSIRREELRNG